MKITPVDEQIFKGFIKEAEIGPKLKDAINHNYWWDAFEIMKNKYTAAFPVWTVVRILKENADIDVLKGTLEVPAYWFANWQGDLNIREGIESICSCAMSSPRIETLYLPSTLKRIDFPIFGKYHSTNDYVKKIFFNGTPKQWQKILKNSGGFWSENLVPEIVEFKDGTKW